MKISKNPSSSKFELAKEILKNADDFEFIINGADGEIFYFIIYSKISIENINLLPNEYILKIFRRGLSENILEHFIKLSNFKLIPRIFVLNSVFIIMQYIEGITLNKYLENMKLKITIGFNTNLTKLQIYEKIKKLLDKYHSLNLTHNDLNPYNILISKNDVFFIDPLIPAIGNKKIDMLKRLDMIDLENYKELLGAE